MTLVLGLPIAPAIQHRIVGDGHEDGGSAGSRVEEDRSTLYRGTPSRAGPVGVALQFAVVITHRFDKLPRHIKGRSRRSSRVVRLADRVGGTRA